MFVCAVDVTKKLAITEHSAHSLTPAAQSTCACHFYSGKEPKDAEAWENQHNRVFNFIFKPRRMFFVRLCCNSVIWVAAGLGRKCKLRRSKMRCKKLRKCNNVQNRHFKQKCRTAAFCLPIVVAAGKRPAAKTVYSKILTIFCIFSNK